MEPTTQIQIDVQIVNHGSIILFHLLTEAAESFLDHLSEDRQMFGNALVVEPRYAESIARAMIENFGLMVR